MARRAAASAERFAADGTIPLKLAGAVLLDAFLDPDAIDSRGTDGELYCGEPIVSRLIGGDRGAVSEHMPQASPLALLPYGIRQEYVVSSLRYPSTPPRPLANGRTTYAVRDYPALARAKGDAVNVQIIPNAKHFDFVTPGTKHRKDKRGFGRGSGCVGL